MKTKIYTALMVPAFLMIWSGATAQEKKAEWGVKFKGFVNHEMIYDSRQAVAARDGDVLLYPAPVKNDPDGNDINASSQFNALAVTSRLQAVITGPEAFGAKTSGMISGDFFGTANDKIGVFRLRQAFVKLSWKHSELLAGKAWHPLFATAVFPKVLSFGAGIPFYPLSRAPQLSYTLKGKHFEWLTALATQQDFATAGPSGRTPNYLRNTGMPEINTRLMYKSKNVLLGAGVGFWQIKPKTATEAGYKTEEKVDGMLFNAFGKFDLPGVTARAGYLYGKNVSNFFMFGGFGVSSITEDEKMIETYEPTAGSSLWADLETRNKTVNFGLFAGYTKNLGADAPITGDIYGVGTNIDSYYRISPRVSFTSGKVRVGLEGIYHSAAYGTLDDYGKVVDTQDVDGIRLLTSVCYFF